jgi:hypothetical protein
VLFPLGALLNAQFFKRTRESAKDLRHYNEEAGSCFELRLPDGLPV